MIHINNISKKYANKTLFEGLSLHIRPRDRIALVGENGTGKSTLMKIIAGLEQEDTGEINMAGNITIEYLPQFLPFSFSPNITVYTEASKAFAEIFKLGNRLSELEHLMGELEPDTNKFNRVMTRYSNLLEELNNKGYYELDAKIKAVLFGLGFVQKDLNRKCVEFSGGWQMRILLAKFLIKRPNVLLLDEPTNHLDIESRNWLESFIKDYDGAVVLVSHDRYFLDATVTRTAEIYAGEMKTYNGNFSKFEKLRIEYIDMLHKKAEDYEKLTDKTEKFINRFRAKASKASQVQSRVKQLEKMGKVKIPPKRKKIHFRFAKAPSSGQSILKVDSVGKQFGDHIVFMDAKFQVERGDRIAVLGKNGAGKTTLIKLITGELKPDSGTIEFGHNVKLGYYAQEPSEALHPTATVYQEIYNDASTEMVPQIRNILGAFLFHDDEIEKPISVLSGGERSRLSLAKMLLKSSNLLILDEPTNHLDIYSKDILMDALKYFEGTIIFVSHDRYFIDEIATKIVYIKDMEVQFYNGTYENFLNKIS